MIIEKRALSLITLGLCLPLITGCPKRSGDFGSAADTDLLSLDGGRDDIAMLPGSRDSLAGAGQRDHGLAAIQFNYDSAQIAASEQGKLRVVAEYMRRHSRVRLVVEGHCDERGSREYNTALGERRALAARAYLVGLGVRADRIHTRSYGEEKPNDPQHNESAWRANRRGEFVIYN